MAAVKTVAIEVMELADRSGYLSWNNKVLSNDNVLRQFSKLCGDKSVSLAGWNFSCNNGICELRRK